MKTKKEIGNAVIESLEESKTKNMSVSEASLSTIAISISSILIVLIDIRDVLDIKLHSRPRGCGPL